MGKDKEASGPMKDIDARFREFIREISIGYPQDARIDRAAETISEFLAKSYNLPQRNIFLQGSYANGTAVEPTSGGEYDVDLVCRCVNEDVPAEAALDDLARRFRSDGRYRTRVVVKRPCVRLNYAKDDVGDFHVDVVPVRSTGRPTPPLDAPRRHEGWHGTDPAAYTEWARELGTHYAHTVQAMKRWRDEQQGVRMAIKSIVLQVLVAKCMPKTDSDANRLAETFQNLHTLLSNHATPPRVVNPVLESENLASRWTQESFESFKAELADAAHTSQLAQQATTITECAGLWRDLLGESFPAQTSTQIGLEVGDYSHAVDPSTKGWHERLGKGYSITIGATKVRRMREIPLLDDGEVIFPGYNIHYRAKIIAPRKVDVWWQVANTGGHARSANGLRGDIFKGRKLNQNPTLDPAENWEQATYTGTHLIRAMLVRNEDLVAKSSWFRVNIFNPRHLFHR